MIKSVHFQNFKSMKDVRIDLERFTVIVGPNGSGKTSVLEGLYELSDDFEQRRPEAPYLWNQVLQEFCTYGAAEGMSINVETVDGERCSKTLWPLDTNGEGSSQSEASPPSSSCQKALAPCVFLQLEATKLAASSYSNLLKPKMTRNGEGFSSVLAYMVLNQPDSFQELLRLFQRVIPSVSRIRFDRQKPTESLPQNPEKPVQELIVFDFVGAEGIPAHRVSEGTILVLGLIGAMMNPPRPHLVLLDDLERGLHPKAQRELVDQIRTILDQNPEMQIVATTHSPYLLDKLRPEEVRITTLDENGHTVCGRLDAHPKFEKWKDEMTPGEFWSLIGEQWVVEREAVGNPK
ncbi:MAG: AAA family ATPase [Gemmataceae bacterium]